MRIYNYRSHIQSTVKVIKYKICVSPLSSASLSHQFHPRLDSILHQG